MRAIYLLKPVALALFGMTALLVQAQTDTWLGGTGMWSQMANWSLDAVPGSGNDCIIPANSAPNVDVNGICHNLTIAAGNVWPIPNSQLIVYGPSVVNPASLSFGPSFKGGLLVGGGTGLTTALTGGGTITLLGPNNEIGENLGGTFMNVDNTISGQGFVGVGDIGIINQATITASGGTLNIFPSPLGVTNTGILQASSGATLNLTDSGGQGTVFNNTGGSIIAQAGSTVTLTGGTISGGTLTSVGSGLFSTPAGGVNPAWSNLTSTANYVIVPGGSSTLLGTITNNGTIQAQGVLFISGNVTLTGSGSVPMTSTGSINSLNGSGTLANQSSITGSGAIGDSGLTVNNQSTINATDTAHPLVLGGLPLNNTSTLEASGGGTLQIGNTVNNTGGTIAAETGSTVLLDFGTINGGTLTTSGTGTFQSISGILDGTVNIPSNAGLFTVANGNSLNMKGTINNTGTFALDSTGGCIDLEAPLTLTGTGKVTMAGTGNCFLSFSSTYTLTNHNTIEGAGSIGDSNPMPIVNSGTILANVSGGTLTVQPDATVGFTNHGTLSVLAGSTLNISGLFTNFSNNTLKGGIYSVMGTFEFLNASIKSNAGNITLTGTSAKIIDTLTGNNALKNFSTNAAGGIFSLQMGAAAATAGKFTNRGKLTVGAGSAFGVVSSYTQSSGTTTVDGMLTVPALTVSGGSLAGQGTVTAAVTQSGGTITVGDSSTKPGILTVTGSYSESTVTGSLNVGISGNTVGSQYSQLAVSNGISLDGVLNIKLINGFIPAVGSSFTILKGTAVTGTFSTVNGTSINSSEHFQVNYNPSDVTLSVVPGP